MNGNKENWRRCASESGSDREDQIQPKDRKSKSLETGVSDMYGGTEDSCMPGLSASSQTKFRFAIAVELGDRNSKSDHGVKQQDKPTTATRRMELCSRTSSCRNPTSSGGASISREMKVSAFIRLVNSSDFGGVLTERQLLRHRRAAPTVDSGPGKIDVVAFIAFLCSRRSRKVRESNRIGVAELSALIMRQKYRCALTGEELTPENLALDHIIPISEGGDFTIENSQFVTKSVNRAKNTMLEDSFVEMCEQVTRTRGKTK